MDVATELHVLAVKLHKEHLSIRGWVSPTMLLPRLSLETASKGNGAKRRRSWLCVEEDNGVAGRQKSKKVRAKGTQLLPLCLLIAVPAVQPRGKNWISERNFLFQFHPWVKFYTCFHLYIPLFFTLPFLSSDLIFISFLHFIISTLSKQGEGCFSKYPTGFITLAPTALSRGQCDVRVTEQPAMTWRNMWRLAACQVYICPFCVTYPIMYRSRAECLISKENYISTQCQGK